MPKIQTAELNWVLFKTGKIVQTSGFIRLFLFFSKTMSVELSNKKQ